VGGFFVQAVLDGRADDRGHRRASSMRDNADVDWSARYWAIALVAWVVVSVGAVAWTLATSSAWKYPEAWSGAWLLFIVALWWAIATLRSDSDHSGSPEEILKRRFARGEIDAAEYRRTRATLKGE
jgi:hypothetical protein